MPNTEQSIEQTGGIPEIDMELEVYGMVQTPVDPSLSIPEMAADAKATGDAINNVAADVTDIAADIATILEWTGEDIYLNATEKAKTNGKTIADAIEDIESGVVKDVYPVGSIIMTISNSEPTFPGTWTEIAITATWNQLKSGTRGYNELAEGQSGGSVHFWLRTE